MSKYRSILYWKCIWYDGILTKLSRDATQIIIYIVGFEKPKIKNKKSVDNETARWYYN